MTQRSRAERTSQQSETSRPADSVLDPRWLSIVKRDRSADGSFYYSVRTTGVYCRPSCGARLARPENVEFHRTCDEAESAGFRPCRRCRPRQPGPDAQNAGRIARACQLIETAEEMPSLSELASSAGLSAYHFHRTFKAITGVTPKQYALARRHNRIRHSLQQGGTVTSAVYEAGFNSSSRFYEVSNELLGMTPSRYRAGGTGIDITYGSGQCSLGAVLIARSDKGVCAILLGEESAPLVRDLKRRFPKANVIDGGAGFEQLVTTVVHLLEEPARAQHLPLDVRGTAFQQRVWRALQQIPPGSTSTYSEIARQIGAPTATRAVAHACAANPIAVAIPCHRVVRRDGSLAGYRWGVERKRALLAREAGD